MDLLFPNSDGHGLVEAAGGGFRDLREGHSSNEESANLKIKASYTNSNDERLDGCGNPI